MWPEKIIVSAKHMFLKRKKARRMISFPMMKKPDVCAPLLSKKIIVFAKHMFLIFAYLPDFDSWHQNRAHPVCMFTSSTTCSENDHGGESQSDEAAHEEAGQLVQDLHFSCAEASTPEDWAEQEIDDHHELFRDG